MRARDTDKDWESLAQTEPYWAVLTHERFRSAVITDSDLADFFASGEEHINSTLSGIRRLFDPDFTPQFALDFGCGVGRLLLPLARVSTRAVGVDISGEMLRIARKHLETHHLSAELVKSAEGFAGYDLLVSAIVFQHIVPERGYEIFRGLVEGLAQPGYLHCQFMFAKDRRFLSHATDHFDVYRTTESGIELLQQTDIHENGPLVSMYDYDLNKLNIILQRAGIREIFYHYTDHGGCLGVVMWAKK